MRNVFTLATKDLKILWRDRAALFWVFVWPLVFAFFFGSILGGGGSRGGAGMKIAVVDEDSTATSQKFVALLEGSAALRVQRSVDRELAWDAVRTGDRVAFVIIEEGYGAANWMFGGDEQPMKIGIDPSRQAEAGYLQGILTEAAFKLQQEKMSDPVTMREQLQDASEGLDGSAGSSDEQQRVLLDLFTSLDRYYATADSGTLEEGMQMGGGQIEVEEVVREQIGRPRSAFEISFPSAMLWALIACASTFAVSMVLERQGGTLLRLRTSPLSRMQIMGGKALACFLTCVGIVVALLTLAQLFFGVRIGDPRLLVIAVLCAGFCFTGLMMLFSVLGKTPRAVGGVSWAIMLAMAMFGGGMIPLIAMPDWMQVGSNVSPVKWAILALEGGIWRDFTLADAVLPCLVLLGVGSVSFAIGLRVFSWTEA
jgi:ABC-2 type transport system permease protein